MNKIRILIGIGFFFIIATILMGNNQKCTNLSNTTMKDGNSSIVLALKTAATTNYKLDYNFTWAGSGADSGSDIALDNSGNVYITGNTQSFGAGLNDVFFAKYNSINGNYLSNITWGSSDSEEGFDIALDDLGNIYITGSNLSIAYDAFIAKFNSTTGESLLNITWGGSLTDRGYSIALDDSENIYITGYTQSFGAGGDDAFVAKFNSTGDLVFNITWGNSNDEVAEKILLDGLGNVYITGGTETIGENFDDAFVAKFNSTTGESLLNITWGGSGIDSGTGLELDNFGNIYIIGNTQSFGAGGDDALVAKFNSTGDLEFNITWGGSNSDFGSDIALDNSRNIYIIGRTYSFGTAGSLDVFVAKYDNCGKSLLNITWGGDYDDSGNGIVLDDSGNIYITGDNYSFSAGFNDAFIIKYSIVREYIPPSDDDDDDDDDEVSPIIIPGYDLFYLLGFLGLSIVFLMKKGLK